ncbi:MAG: HDOD domain-containing protein [Kofleriaceae bacterium]
MEPLHAYVGRQAIFDRDLKVVGYELLYRNSAENRARFDDADQATAATMLNAFVELGLDRLVGAQPVWVNLPASFLLGKYPLPLPPERTVIEVLEDVPVTPALIEALRGFRAQGFRIALDDFLLTDETRPLVALADVVKISVLNVPVDDVRAQYAELRPISRTLLAEKVSTHEEMEAYHGLGFELFQGHFLQMPIVSRGERLPHNRAALMQLLSKLYDPKLDMRAIEKLISAEVGLAVRLLKLASSVAMTRGAPIGTIGQAIQRVGIQQVAAMVLLLSVAGFDDKPFELARQALIRARMCEGLARSSGAPADQLFTAGLLSLLDALLDLSLDEVLRQLPVTDVIRDALSGKTSDGARIVEAVRGQDRADFARVARTGLPASAVFVAWYEAVRWADELIALI